MIELDASLREKVLDCLQDYYPDTLEEILEMIQRMEEEE